MSIKRNTTPEFQARVTVWVWFRITVRVGVSVRVRVMVRAFIKCTFARRTAHLVKCAD